MAEEASVSTEIEKVQPALPVVIPAAAPAPKPRRRAAPKSAENAPAGESKASNPSKHLADDTVLLLFGKYDLSSIQVTDQSIVNYIKFTRQPYPNLFGRRKNQAYYNSHINIVERLMNKLMRGGTGKKVGGKVIRTEGRLQGKKLKVMHIVEDAFESIHQKTGKNPVQVFVDAMQNAAPIEDTTRVRYGGISYNVAVGISSNRRVDVALRNIALSALINAFNKKKTLAQALADEILLAATKAPDSYAIKKRTEGERIARRAR